ncbi:hypothetical protein PCANC_00519 [Puccinia coronata f. sp. avenae]|uniref:F-box domain-containing protein n=1 Tax=Puccinia coronata f. sp. avenae TaxID=200324 RepID=A0A2N5W7V2_9BASI|nr:hypothetical protein PCANC_00519 [Puccinia coronata f. sp. avenae]
MLAVAQLVGDSSTGFLKAAANPSPLLNCAIRNMILTDYKLDKLALSALLESCASSLRTLEITSPGYIPLYKLDRAVLCRILQGCTSLNLESLTLKSSHRDSPTSPKNLKTLSFPGTMATGGLFKRLPNSANNQNLFPNLKCCSVRSRYGWSPADELAVRAALRMQGACFHVSLDRMYGLPTLTDAMEDEERGDEEDIREMDHWLPPAVTSNIK